MKLSSHFFAIPPVILAIMFSFSSCQTQNALNGAVRTGLDVLIDHHFQELSGKNIGLVTNHTAIARNGEHAIDILFKARDVNLVALFGPEHGLRGRNEAGAHLNSGIDQKTGLPVFSLYGDNKKPTAEMLRGIDALVFDIQDIGTRFYTYISTMSLAMEAAAENDIEFYVLDRPNPIGGTIVEGPVLDPAFKSFVGIHPIALRHGMTIGELATMFNEEGWLKDGAHAKLQVIPIEHWHRDMFFDKTGLIWVKPSPNMVSLQTALLYPGMGLLEATNVSEGRGTEHPFEQIGAPWIDAEKLANRLNALHLSGIRIDTTSFTTRDMPGMATNPKYEGLKCHGLKLTVTDKSSFQSVLFGIHLLCSIRDLHPDKFKLKERWMKLLTGTTHVYNGLKDGLPAEEIAAEWQDDLKQFHQKRKKYLLYQ